MGTQQPTEGEAVNELATALAVTKEDMAALSTEQRAAIAERKNANIVSAQMAGTNWGKGLDQPTRRAVSDWGQRHGIDVATEIFVLGGSIYLNAQFYINRLVEMVKAGHVLDFSQDMVQHDARLGEVLAEVLPADASDEERAELREAQAKARREIRRRRDIRIMYGIPESATAAVVTTIRLTRLPSVPFVGIKWAPHANSQHRDPVGTDYPQESALTRSARRALKQVVRHLPEVVEWLEGAEEDAIATVDTAIRASVERSERAAVAAGPEPKQLTEGPVRTMGAVQVPEAEFLAHELAAAAVASRRRSSGGPVSVEAPGSDPYGEKGPQDGPNGEPNPFLKDETTAPSPHPVAPDLFGGVSPMEPTAEQRAAADNASDDGHDDMEDLTPTERAAMERLSTRRGG